MRFSTLAAAIISALALAGFFTSTDAGLRLYLWDRFLTLAGSSLHAFIVAACCCAAGYAAFPAKTWRGVTRLEVVLFCFGCGAGLFSFVVLTLGVLGWTQKSVLWAAVAATLLAAILRLRFSSAHFPVMIADASRFQSNRLGLTLAARILAGVAVLLLVTGSLTPALLFDVTEYHLGAFTDYRQTDPPGRIIPLSHNFYGRFPFPIETLYHFALLLGAPLDYAPKLLNAVFVMACSALMFAALARKRVAPRWHWLAVLLVLSHPIMLDVCLDAFIDAASAFLVLAGVFAIGLAGSTRRTKQSDYSSPDELSQGEKTLVSPVLLVVGALLFGTALASKYTVAQLYLAPFALLFYFPAVWRIRDKRLIAASLVAGSAPLLFWLAKNVLFYGNPLEPFFQKLFHADDPLAISREQFYIASHFPQAFWSTSYWATFLPRMKEFSWLHLSLLIAVPALPALRSRHTGRVLSFILLSYLSWNLIRESQNRFLLPAILLVIYLGAQILNNLPVAWLRRLLGCILLLFAFVNLSRQALKLSGGGTFAYLSDYILAPQPLKTNSEESPDPRDQYYQTNLGALGEMRSAMHSQLSADAKILMVYEARPYLFSRSTAYNTVWDDSALLTHAGDAATSGQIADNLRAAGFTHLLVNREELRRYIQQYATPAQLQSLGIPPGADPANAFFLAPYPEDLFPSFYRDPQWSQSRQAVIEFLSGMQARAIVTKGRLATEIYLAPL